MKISMRPLKSSSFGKLRKISVNDLQSTPSGQKFNMTDLARAAHRVAIIQKKEHERDSSEE
jgi:hypothetical protein